MTPPVGAVPPDTKDWTWVLRRSCSQCGVDAGSLAADDLPDLLRRTAQAWREVLGRDDVGSRRDPAVWSPLEYACHVRDVHGVFDDRVRLMVEQVDPTFESWDQDQAAVDGRYTRAVPHQVALDLEEAAERVAARYAALGDEQWERTGRRGDGMVFTVVTLGQYHAHDVLHHLVDAGG